MRYPFLLTDFYHDLHYNMLQYMALAYEQFTQSQSLVKGADAKNAIYAPLHCFHQRVHLMPCIKIV